MSSYSRLERKIARFMSRFPVVKKVIKEAYSRFAYLRNRKSYRILTETAIVEIGREGKESFFGYYDKSPSNSTGSVIACVSSLKTDETPTSLNTISIEVFDFQGEFVLNREVRAYNWQQGCRAHWLNDDLIIYNDYSVEDKKYKSHVLSVKKNTTVKSFNYPVQDSFGTDYFISINYERLMVLRPDYGYRNLPPLADHLLKDLDNDGLWKINYGTGESELLVSLADAARFKPIEEFNYGMHKFNHVIISPDGSKLIFMHRCVVKGRRIDRLFLADASSGQLTLIADTGMVSHCFWVDNTRVLGFMRGPDGVDAYWLVDLHTLQFERLLNGSLDSYGDGHPHVSGEWFVTDTYPDRSRMQSLLLCNWKTGELMRLGEFFHDFNFSGECRCDLHPRFSIDGKYIFFDSVYSGKRKLYRMERPN